MIVIGVDVHKQSVTAVAVDESGRMLDERTVRVGSDELVRWASELGAERLWALEDCRQLTPWLERQLLGLGEELVRVSPKLTVAGRSRGKSDPIDALAVARAALREPDLPRPQLGEQIYREIKLLVDHRDRPRRRTAPNPAAAALASPPARSDLRAAAAEARTPKPSGPRRLARQERTLQVRLARELVARCRSLTRTIDKLDRELKQRTEQTAPALLELPGCGAITAAKLLAEIGPISRFKSDAQLARHGGVAPLEASSGRIQRHRLDRGGNRQLNSALYRIAITQSRYHPGARAYLERKQAEGKSKREAIRCLKRLLVRTVFTTLKASPTLT
jgi:transposase